MKNLKIKDAQQIHVSFEKCTNVEASNLMITASENSPNTDGIHVADTYNIQISNSTIGTGLFNFNFNFNLTNLQKKRVFFILFYELIN